MGASEPVVHEVAFRAAEDLVGKWAVGGFTHHTQLRRELAETGGVEFLVTFSKPTPRQPVPEQVALVTVTVEPPVDVDAKLSVSYAVESQLQKHPSSEPLRLAWLDSIVHRKQSTQAAVALFAKKGELTEPRAFVPGEYGASAPRSGKGGRGLAVKCDVDAKGSVDVKIR